MSLPSEPVGGLRLVGEAARIAVARPVATVLVGAIVAAVGAVILLTTGQTVAAENDVLSRIDEAGTRSIVITDDQGTAMLRPQVVDRVGAVAGVEWVIGLGYASDGENSWLGGGGAPVAVRTLYGDLPEGPVTVNGRAPAPGEALVGVAAAATLGFEHGIGGVELGGDQLAVVGIIDGDGPLGFLDTGMVAAPAPDDTTGPLRSIHIVVDQPSQVAAVAVAARRLLDAEDATSVSVTTSETLADVRAAVAGELGRYGRNLVLLILGAGLVLVGLTVYGSVTLQRQDFGRRRALGATRTAIVTLVTVQNMLVAMIGTLFGVAVATAVALWRQDLGPSLTFAVAVGVLAVVATAAAAVVPAVIAAHRDPVRVLRVP
ncbi:MAG: ABC transporter permease [Acidimicrobiia bacterium]|nr:ABC transporter permease [Acidimicrobiia bacterium]